MVSPSPRPASQGVFPVQLEGYATCLTPLIHNFRLYLASQAPDTITIDASEPSPEQGDRILQDLLMLAALQLMPTNPPLPSHLGDGGVRKTAEAIAKRVAELHMQHKECFEALSAGGWFLRPDTPVNQLQALRDSMRPNNGSGPSTIAMYLEDRIDSIENDLSQTYVHRAHILHDAFDAHRAKRYTLSVPVFFSQADGIWRDRFDQHFFSRARKETLRHQLNDIQLQYLVTALKVLIGSNEDGNNPMWASENERGSSWSALNRHQVLHGESVDYATEENSLKAIALLDCFQCICRRVSH